MRWDGEGAFARLTRLRVPTDRPVATLSGGQRAQVALGLALAKQPRLLLLDEPVAALDPLARREFLSTLSEAVTDGDVSVILSSHLVHDLERVCDHVILLSASRVQLCADIDDVLASHRMLLGPRRPVEAVEPGLTVISATQTQRQTRLLVRTDGPVLDPSWEQAEVGLEDVILAYMGNDGAGIGAERTHRHLEVAP
jgi:ABC-2 type transport system ATP-binding protein